MVSHMPNQEVTLDRVFRALADPTRRAVLERLGAGPASVSDLAQPFEMALPTFAQHLKVLEACGLVRSSKAGRVRTCELAPQAFVRAEHWMAAQRALWQARLDQLDLYVRQLHEKERTHGKRRRSR
jgi:DNA-binding transcriptional ArsR family regulator